MTDVLDAVVAGVLAGPARLGEVRLVCVDGPAGSGKTTTAVRLAELVRAAGCRVQILHLDDMYEGWSGLDGVAGRLEEQVLEPLAAGRPARYQRYDWALARFADWRTLEVSDVLVVEGCGSAARVIAARASSVLWVEAPADLRLDRGIARDGEDLREHWLRWMGLEAVHFAREGTRQRADVLLDGTAGPPP